MLARAPLPICAVLLSCGLAVPALAQAAAETATILSGTGQGTGSAARGMGSAVSGSINNASSAIRTTRSAGPRPGRSRGRGARGGFEIPASGDSLEGTDAPTYTLGNGASIRVSGTMVRAVEPACTENCPQAPESPNSAP